MTSSLFHMLAKPIAWVGHSRSLSLSKSDKKHREGEQGTRHALTSRLKTFFVTFWNPCDNKIIGRRKRTRWKKMFLSTSVRIFFLIARWKINVEQNMETSQWYMKTAVRVGVICICRLDVQHMLWQDKTTVANCIELRMNAMFHCEKWKTRTGGRVLSWISCFRTLHGKPWIHRWLHVGPQDKLHFRARNWY